MDKLSLPAARAEQLCIDLCERRAEDGPEQVMRDLPDSLRLLPTVSLRGAAVPVGDHVAHVTHEDRVVREVKQVGSLPQRLIGLVEVCSPLLHLGLLFITCTA